MSSTSKYSELFSFFRTCPQLASLWSVGATENIGVSVILPQGSSEKLQHNDYIDAAGGFNSEISPLPSVYEDYQINCYRPYDANDSTEPSANINVLSLDEVQDIITWIEAQDEAGNLPTITGKTVISMECHPFVPQVLFVNNEEGTICYFITVRIWYVNKAKPKVIEA